MAIGVLLLTVMLARLSFTTGEACQSNCEESSLLQSKGQSLQNSARSTKIIVKGPSPSGGTASQQLSPTCAQGFNEAFAKCLGGKNNYLMILMSNQDDTKAYCAYTGGWAQTPDNYPDPSACFVSPGEKEPLFFDSSTGNLVNWDKKEIVPSPLKQDFTSLSCNGAGDSPCSSTVTNKYARKLTKGGKPWQEVPAGGEFTFEWSPSDGYIGVTTITPQKIYSMYVKNNLGSSSSNGLSADVPCAQDTSVEWQAKNFPVKGLNGGCQKDNDDYWMAFGSGDVTICFLGVAC
mmetsp:Transcript_54335/g.66678  ORF Transcript_54335/g.66678 Transcript_54335/m.66678 type:complete len:290 (-) Transcript_54335:92-961(-)